MTGPFKFQINLPKRHPSEERAKLLHSLGSYQEVGTGKRYPTMDRVPILAWCACLVLVVLLAVVGIGHAATHRSHSHSQLQEQ